MADAVERWLAAALADARARGVPDAAPVLEAFAGLMRVLRMADWTATADHSRAPDGKR